MKILTVVQGSPEWLAARALHLCASDAPAMMGASNHMKRDELLRQKATGDTPEIDPMTQALFDRGHDTEARARPIVEEMIGEELYPVTASDDASRLLASFDGITMAGETGFEHKLWNEELAAAIRAGEVPPSHYWQLEQQILIGNLERVIFACSDGTKKKFVHTEYLAVPGRAEALLAGWKQFEEDVANYKHVNVLPAPNGREIKELPAISVELIGTVQSSNLAAYKTQALAFIESINTELKTDQDFADADKNIKFCSEAEERIESVKANALSKTASIDELFKTLDYLRDAMRGKRLALNKLVTARKESIRADILREGQTSVAQHIMDLNKRLGAPYMPVVPTDFAGQMKGKKTITSLRDAVNTELSKAKIAANAIADKIGVNLNVMRDLAAEHQFLFSDLAQIVLKENDDFTALVKMRIAEHRAKEAARLESERDRIRKEEEVRAQAAVQVAPVPTAQPAPRPMPSNVTPLRKPTDDEIIGAVAAHFNVPSAKAIDWLLGVNLQAAKKRLIEEPVT